MVCSCKESKLSDIEIIKFNPKIIDSLKQTSDTSYTEIIGASDFYTADYYINRKDTITIKILKDFLGHVMGINKSKNGHTFFAAEYYIISVSGITLNHREFGRIITSKENLKK